MFAHCAVGTTSQPKATSLGEADITCPQGQTSFGAPALSQVAVRVSFLENFAFCEYTRTLLASLLSDKSSGIQPEFQKQLSNIVKRIEDLLRDNSGECDIPDDLIKEIARCLVPDIIAFFKTEEAKREFEAWKLEQEQKLANKAKNEAMPK